MPRHLSCTSAGISCREYDKQVENTTLGHLSGRCGVAGGHGPWRAIYLNLLTHAHDPKSSSMLYGITFPFHCQSIKFQVSSFISVLCLLAPTSYLAECREAEGSPVDPFFLPGGRVRALRVLYRMQSVPRSLCVIGLAVASVCSFSLLGLTVYHTTPHPHIRYHTQSYTNHFLVITTSAGQRWRWRRRRG